MEHQITVNRIAHRTKVLTVTADTREQAERIALNIAGGEDFGAEKHADYEVDGPPTQGVPTKIAALEKIAAQLAVGRQFLPTHGSFGEEGINAYEHAEALCLKAIADAKLPTFLVRWDGRDGDGAILCRGAKDADAAITAVVAEEFKGFRLAKIDEGDSPGAYVVIDGISDDDWQSMQDAPCEFHGVYGIHAEPAKVVQA